MYVDIVISNIFNLNKHFQQIVRDEPIPDPCKHSSKRDPTYGVLYIHKKYIYFNKYAMHKWEEYLFIWYPKFKIIDLHHP